MNKIVIVSGSHRAEGASGALAKRLESLVTDHLPNCSSEHLDITDLPFWDEGLWGKPELKDKWASIWTPLAKKLQDADALILLAPEYGGMVPPKLMNFLLICSSQDVGHKPVLAVGVSSTRGGAYPIPQLRAFGFKNNHLCWLPDHLIIRNWDPSKGTDPLEASTYEGQYAVYCLKLLDAYAGALKNIRTSGLIDYKNFPYGM